jgi:cysteine desulfuration protein SufE
MLLQNYTQQFKEIKDTQALSMLMMNLSGQVPDVMSQRTDDNYVYGCQSDVWVWGHCEDNQWQFGIDSDSLFVKALGKIITDSVNGLTAPEIQSLNFINFKTITATLPRERQKGFQYILNHIHKLVGETQ